MLRAVLVAAISPMLLTPVCAQTVSGTVSIQRALTQKSVTSAIPVYSRGATAKLAVPDTDPLAEERTRVVVYLEGAALSGGDRPTTATMTQENRQFSPAVVVVPVGGTVSFPNRDPIFHNIFSLSGPKSFDLGTYDKGQTRTVQFPKSGIVFVYCHLHPNMSGTVVVTPNRYYAQPGRDGAYSITGVPPGRYTMVAWHKAVGFFRRPIVVSSGGVSDVDFLLPFPPAEEGKDSGKGRGEMRH